MRSFVVLLAAVLLGATPGPAPTGGPAGDHLTALVGTWTCRNGANVISSLTFRVDRDAIVADERNADFSFGRVLTQRFRRDGSTGAWHVDERNSPNVAFAGSGAPWSRDSWTVNGVLTRSYDGSSTHDPRSIRYVRVDDDTFYRGVPDDRSASGVRGEVCARGDAPPDPSLCPARDVPGVTLHAVEPDWRSSSRAAGIVHVLVSLDAESRIVATKVQSSSDPQLTGPSLDAARRSTFRTAFHDCRPVPSEYTFSVQYQ